MPEKQAILSELVQLSREIGRPERDHVILGEGNTSALIDESTFYVKASGEQLETIKEDGFVEIHLDRALDLLDGANQEGDALKAALVTTRVFQDVSARPSIEVVMHAVALKYGQARFIGHTHSTAVTQILCSDRAEAFAHARLFPDQIVLCGPDSAFVPYVAPGLPLGKAVHRAIAEYRATYHISPKSILLKNHGIVVLGQTAREVMQMLSMWAKAARIYCGAGAIGTPVVLSWEEIDHIYNRADEKYRRSKLTQ